ncbi:hypothetical protein FRAHR75_480041 [Frankia sp. Hr75.2]|nr:hypothetical protein FRAHR75_480041 [Frankia sp. Hr75.2]SQD93984.1 hypothetical protein FMEAI12_2140012 [Parafrankia sp. Ea1.12]
MNAGKQSENNRALRDSDREPYPSCRRPAPVSPGHADRQGRLAAALAPHEETATDESNQHDDHSDALHETPPR